MNPSTERRKYPRIPYKGIVKIHTVIQAAKRKNGSCVEAQGRDIGIGGLGLAVDGTLDANALFKMSFSVGDIPETEAYARVVWSSKELVGMQFIMLENMAITQIKRIADSV